METTFFQYVVSQAVRFDSVGDLAKLVSHNAEPFFGRQEIEEYIVKTIPHQSKKQQILRALRMASEEYRKNGGNGFRKENSTIDLARKSVPANFARNQRVKNMRTTAAEFMPTIYIIDTEGVRHAI